MTKKEFRALLEKAFNAEIGIMLNAYDYDNIAYVYFYNDNGKWTMQPRYFPISAEVTIEQIVNAMYQESKGKFSRLYINNKIIKDFEDKKPMKYKDIAKTI